MRYKYSLYFTGNRITKELNNLLEITELVRDDDEIWILIVWLHSPCPLVEEETWYGASLVIASTVWQEKKCVDLLWSQ